MINEILERPLIIGGTGFIGSNITAELVKLGCQPTVVSRNNARHNLIGEAESRTNFIELDMRNTVLTKEFILDLQPTLIINAASTFGLEDYNGQSARQINFDAYQNLLESALAARTSRIILFGSADEYGYQPTPQNENLTLNPNSPYANSKAEVTQLVKQMYEAQNLPAVILRPFTVYGTAQPKGMFLSDAIRCALDNELFEMSEGKQLRDYVFIADFVRAVICAVNAVGIEGQVFNIGSGTARPLREIAKKVWEISGADQALLKIGARKASISELHNTCADISKAADVLKWQPEISLEEGLNQTIRSIKNQRKNLLSNARKTI